jgi:hypothetical protein
MPAAFSRARRRPWPQRSPALAENVRTVRDASPASTPRSSGYSSASSTVAGRRRTSEAGTMAAAAVDSTPIAAASMVVKTRPLGTVPPSAAAPANPAAAPRSDPASPIQRPSRATSRPSALESPRDSDAQLSHPACRLQRAELRGPERGVRRDPRCTHAACRRVAAAGSSRSARSPRRTPDHQTDRVTMGSAG